MGRSERQRAIYLEYALPKLKKIFKRNGLHGAIVGGVARRGHSFHDLDLYIDEVAKYMCNPTEGESVKLGKKISTLKDDIRKEFPQIGLLRQGYLFDIDLWGIFGEKLGSTYVRIR